MTLNLGKLDPTQLFRLKTHRAYRKLLQGEDWKIVLADLARTNFLSRPTIVPGDPVTTSYNEGRRMAVIDILTVLGSEEEEVLKGFQHERQGVEE